MENQFTLSDLAGVAEAILAFSFVVLAPGYVIAWVFRLMAFRQRRLLTRLALAVPISIGICPILTYLLGRFVPPAVWVFYAACAVAFPALLCRERRQLLSNPPFPRERLLWAILAGWIVLGTLSLVDMQIGDHLYFPTVAFDYSLRSTVTASVAHSGIPVHNPFFFPGRPSVMRYHYFWFILCGVAQRITASTVTSRQALIGGTIWCGIGLMALVALYLRFFQSRGSHSIDTRTLFTIALLGVTGLDILPVLALEWSSHSYYGDMEWWNDQVSAWVTTALWTPNHLSGLIACLMGFLLIWDAGQPGARHRKSAAAAAGLMFASAVGLTVDVTAVFAVFLFIWTFAEFLKKHRHAVILLCLAGCVAAAASLPFLAELLSRESGGAKGLSPLHLAVRSFYYIDQHLNLAPYHWKTNIVHLIVLPINYLLELGFFLIVGVIQLHRMWRNRREVTQDQLCGLTMALTSIIICSFVSSAVNSSGNDLGWRGFLPAQFILLLWGGEMMADGLLSRFVSPDHRAQSRISGAGFRMLVAATLLLGAAGSLYEIFKVRFYPLLSDTTSTRLYAWLSLDREVGARSSALRQLYDELRRQTPDNAVFQHNPRVSPNDIFHGLYADRQVAAEVAGCGLFAGSESKLCWSIVAPIAGLFEKPDSVDAGRIDEVCARYSIDILVVKDTDRAWKDPLSWVWKRAPLVANDYGRAFACGPSTARPPTR